MFACVSCTAVNFLANCRVTAVQCVLLSLLYIVFPTLRGELKMNIKFKKCPISCTVEESFKNFLDLDPDADDFQSLTSFFPVHGYVSGKRLMKIRSVMFMRSCSQTDNQSINQSLFANAITSKQQAKKRDRLPEQAIAQQSWPP